MGNSLFPRSGCSSACGCYYRYTNVTTDYTVLASWGNYSDGASAVEFTIPEEGFYKVSIQGVGSGMSTTDLQVQFTIDNVAPTYGTPHIVDQGTAVRAFSITQDIEADKNDVIRVQLQGSGITISEASVTIMRVY